MKEKLLVLKNMFVNKKILAERNAHLNSRNEMFQIRCMKENDLKTQIIDKDNQVIELMTKNQDLISKNLNLSTELEHANKILKSVDSIIQESKTISAVKKQYNSLLDED